MVRPRGWHLVEKHVLVDGQPVSASLFDFGLFFFHNAAQLVANGTGPYFYLPKLESHLEARLWNEVFVAAAEEFGMPRGTIRATVLIETIWPRSRWTRSCGSCASIRAGSTAAAGITSSASSRSSDAAPEFVLPDRAQVTMTDAFSAVLFATADQDLPPSRRPRDGRHGGADSDQERSGRQRGAL